jgi:hypothetical protein
VVNRDDFGERSLFFEMIILRVVLELLILVEMGSVFFKDGLEINCRNNKMQIVDLFEFINFSDVAIKCGSNLIGVLYGR